MTREPCAELVAGPAFHQYAVAIYLDYKSSLTGHGDPSHDKAIVDKTD